MKREHSHDKDDEATPKDKRRESREREQDQEEAETDKRSKPDTSLDLNDLGAGYDAEDRKVVRAINIYQTKLLPYIEAHSSTFRKSNFLSLKGYASGISPGSDHLTSSSN